MGRVVIWVVTVLAASALGCASRTPSMPGSTGPGAPSISSPVPSGPSASFAAGVRYNGRPFGLQSEASTWVTDGDILGALGSLDGYPAALDLQGAPWNSNIVSGKDLDSRAVAARPI